MTQDIQYCPHCGQKMMVYARSIRPDMVAALRLFAESGGAHKVSDFNFSRGVNADFTKMRYWGLIELAAKERWRVTLAGLAFLAGDTQIPKYKFIYNNKVVGDLSTIKRKDKYKLVTVDDITGYEPINKTRVLEKSETVRSHNRANEALLI